MENTKPLAFEASAGDYFIYSLVSLVMVYIPVFGWAFLLNYSGEWFADRALLNGKKIAYRASYGESLKLVFVNGLLMLVTLGIYSFWFYPKMYRYLAAHVQYLDAAGSPVPGAGMTAPAPADATQAPKPPVDPTQSSGPAPLIGS